MSSWSRRRWSSTAASSASRGAAVLVRRRLDERRRNPVGDPRQRHGSTLVSIGWSATSTSSWRAAGRLSRRLVEATPPSANETTPTTPGTECTTLNTSDASSGWPSRRTLKPSSPSASSTAVAISARTAVGTRAGSTATRGKREASPSPGRGTAVRRRPGGSRGRRGARRSRRRSGPRARRRHPCEGDVQRARRKGSPRARGRSTRSRGSRPGSRGSDPRRPRARRYDRTRVRAGARCGAAARPPDRLRPRSDLLLDLAYAANASEQGVDRAVLHLAFGAPPRYSAVTLLRPVAGRAPWRPSPNAIVTAPSAARRVV